MLREYENIPTVGELSAIVFGSRHPADVLQRFLQTETNIILQ